MFFIFSLLSFLLRIILQIGFLLGLWVLVFAHRYDIRDYAQAKGEEYLTKVKNISAYDVATFAEDSLSVVLREVRQYRRAEFAKEISKGQGGQMGEGGLDEYLEEQVDHPHHHKS